jgi:glyoxylase-like metal-dependent hydrolase (beta-lactamase superfamily II)
MSSNDEFGKRICRVPLRSLARPNAYLVGSKEDCCLIDTGTRRCAGQIQNHLRKKGIKLRRIVLTHSHIDHAGGMRLLKKMAGIQTFIHREDAPVFRPSGSPIYPKGWMGVLFRLIERIYSLSPGSMALKTVTNGDRIGSLEVIHAPGHTPGSIMLLDSEQKALFTGDSLCTTKDTLTLPSRAWSSDWKMLLRSIHRVVDLEFDILLPGHGPPISKGASGKTKAFIEKAAGEWKA